MNDNNLSIISYYEYNRILWVPKNMDYLNRYKKYNIIKAI